MINLMDKDNLRKLIMAIGKELIENTDCYIPSDTTLLEEMSIFVSFEDAAVPNVSVSFGNRSSNIVGNELRNMFSK